MKLIQFIGSSRKSDFLIYIAHMISKMGKRTLIVDTSLSNEYKYAFIRTEEDEVLYDLQNIEIISDVRTFEGLQSKLKLANESVENFDYIILDTSDNCTFSNWPTMDETFFVGNEVRFNILKDVEIINDYMDATNQTNVKRIQFESAFNIPEGYLELLLNNRVEFIDNYDPIEYDEKHEYLWQFIQHEYEIPYNRLNKQYRDVLKAVVTEICEVGNADVEAAFNKGIFGRLKKQNLKPNKYNSSYPQFQQELKGVK